MWMKAWVEPPWSSDPSKFLLTVLRPTTCTLTLCSKISASIPVIPSEFSVGKRRSEKRAHLTSWRILRRGANALEAVNHVGYFLFVPLTTILHPFLHRFVLSGVYLDGWHQWVPLSSGSCWMWPVGHILTRWEGDGEWGWGIYFPGLFPAKSLGVSSIPLSSTRVGVIYFSLQIIKGTLSVDNLKVINQLKVKFYYHHERTILNNVSDKPSSWQTQTTPNITSPQ